MRAGSIPATFQRRHAQGNGRKARSQCDRAFFIIRRFCSDVDKFALPLPSPRLRLGEAQGRRPLRRGRELPARYPRSRKLCPTSSQHQIAPNASKPSYFVALATAYKITVLQRSAPVWMWLLYSDIWKCSTTSMLQICRQCARTKTIPQAKRLVNCNVRPDTSPNRAYRPSRRSS